MPSKSQGAQGDGVPLTSFTVIITPSFTVIALNTYWHMGIIINRCVEADTYHRRKQDGRLPKCAQGD
jgi:hypothetical protein